MSIVKRSELESLLGQKVYIPLLGCRLQGSLIGTLSDYGVGKQRIYCLREYYFVSFMLADVYKVYGASTNIIALKS